MTRRYYSSTAQRTTLANPLSSGATTMIVAATTGFPGTRPYTLVIDPDTINEEIVTVTAASGTTLTVTRGEDGTSPVAHDLGATVWHGFTGRDLGEPQAHMDSSSGVHGRTGEVVGDTDTQTLSNKTMSGADNTFTDIPQSAVTGLPADLASKAPINNPTFTGNVTLPASTTLGDLSPTEIAYLNGVTSNVQTQLDSKAPSASPSFTGTVSLPSDTSIGGVTAVELSRLAGVAGNIQSQIDGITGGGVAVPPGGAENDILVKLSGADYDMEWRPASEFVFVPGTAEPAIYADGSLTGAEYTGTWTLGSQTWRWCKFMTANVEHYLTAGIPVVGKLLVVAGGGGGGGYQAGAGVTAGGGGGGGLWFGDYAFGTGAHVAKVGAGGTPGPGGTFFDGGHGPGGDGGVSYFDHNIITGTGGIYCLGGGGGGASSYWVAVNNGRSGGSGGGAGNGGGSGGAGTAGYGYAGGSNRVGGGAGATGDAGGAGMELRVESSTFTEYARGGAAGGEVAGAVGTGNGGGGGGGGDGGVPHAGAYGGSGVVIAMYRIA